MNVTAQTYFDRPTEKAHRQYVEFLAVAATHRQSAAQCREALGDVETGAECLRLKTEAKIATLDGIFAERRALAYLLSDLYQAMRASHTGAVEKAIAARDEARAATDQHLAEIGAKRGLAMNVPEEQSAAAELRFLKNENHALSEIKTKAEARLEAIGGEIVQAIERL